MLAIFNIIARFFTIWVILVCLVAYLWPAPFLPLAKYTTYGLGLIMLTMGMTMKLDDFKLVFSKPKDIIFGMVLRYAAMPAVAWGVAMGLNLPPSLAAGIILVGCCPSGVSANVMTFLSKGDTALSVTVCSLNTIIAPALTPALFFLIAGSLTPVDKVGMIIDVFKVVLLPVGIGLFLNVKIPNQIDKIRAYLPGLTTVIMIGVISAGIALNAKNLATVALIAFVAVALLNGVGYLCGYFGARLFGMNLYKSKAITYAVGMENSSLAMVLALAHIDPVAALPGAIYSMWHNITGSILATFWARSAEKSDRNISA